MSSIKQDTIFYDHHQHVNDLRQVPSDEEKHAALDRFATNVPLIDEPLDEDPEFTYKEQRKIIHRIDRRLILATGLMYCVSGLDRGNLPNAAIAGMTKDLELNVGYRYSIVALVFFITYALSQPPATILTRILGPRIFLPALCCSWGIVMIGFGFPKVWTPLVPLRLLLGLFEAGMFPGSVYVISTWYSRYDQQKRFAAFFIFTMLTSGCGGILAVGLEQMDGLGGYAGWRWLFIMEGILTVVIGVIGYVLMIDFPDRAIKGKHWHFLKENEILFIMRRIKKDRNDGEAEPWNFRKWLSAGADPKVWSFALIFFALTTSGYALSYFLPSLLRENMGFTINESQMLTAPQHVFAAILLALFAWVGDKYHIRGPMLLVNAAMGLTGCALVGYSQAVGARFFGTFLICGGSSGAIPTCVAYQANNIRGQWKRAFTSATLVGFGALGGIAGSLVFRTQDKPDYKPGIWACMACNGLIAVLVCVNTWHFRRENARADRGEKILEGEPSFRYTI
ncbi:uncharacterized protein MYCGRDRAFT_51568 [Zymoseptoria tritici IPO323]|uniref:Major facilitator superfamily (MFS) profile domain-containing protein n=1 Tax=Zymoseptoria tritici (strain CBS 115943 / IPO323) TaxID=336722 RepID=F9XPL9_ZYMTI|nr:uncharacterized protein MYCGRDRAFT_51568 [Zymoseptoria tritici IPO323]EGP82808.1 hypothetical protein MYCGRDRAFT_51568 [Zymoseptoria tritici IPO323]